jgi:5-methyltetrahydrofolate--homocysteine methyltransferase
MIELGSIKNIIIEGDTVKAGELTRSALEIGIPARDLLDKALIPGIRKVGELFSEGQYFLPELLISGEAMEAAVNELKPILSQSGVSSTGRYLIGTVQGDVHDIGKNIVAMMLEGNGWEVTDLGVDVSPERFCTAIEEGDFDIVGMSALLTTTMTKQAETIRALETAGLREKVRVMVGGAPVTQDYANEIGADAYAADAVQAVKRAAILIGITQAEV